MTVVFLRYEQLKTIWGTNNPKKNKVSLALGLLAGIGLSIVANFQVTTLISVSHNIRQFNLRKKDCTSLSNNGF